ncbi:CapA family protein [Novosphingobium sp. PP1Y]|uniref:CapA family protein n=1 Tax=Novosphingobium sp. PP1Y TaxID=702113 RepID=UPI00020EFDF5|nr:CapA family protein [Novosphingobium sp. PP1Y]CCA90969.1 conserved hypothetical protein [Novosphingobium sp. PP1Y]
MPENEDITVGPRGTLQLVVTGDLVLDEPDGDHWLSGIAPALQAADIAIGHLEVPHSRTQAELAGDVPAPGAPPENVASIARAGYAMVSLAGNHIADCGAQGIADTRRELADSGIAFAGAGANLAEAAAPAFIDRAGWRVALLSYNCVGPENGWAAEAGAGSNYLRVETLDGSPIAPAARLGEVAPAALTRLAAEIASVRGKADIVLVAMHKGVVHTTAQIEPYERVLARHAIEAGADAVLGHHAHIVRGIEFHLGKPIFHGLGNGCVVTSALSPAQDHPARREWAERRKKLFGFEPDPAYHLAPFHPEAINAFLGTLDFTDGEAPRVGIVPVTVEAPGRPVLADGARAQEIRTYCEAITRAGGLAPVAISADGSVRAA